MVHKGHKYLCRNRPWHFQTPFRGSKIDSHVDLAYAEGYIPLSVGTRTKENRMGDKGGKKDKAKSQKQKQKKQKDESQKKQQKQQPK